MATLTNPQPPASPSARQRHRRRFHRRRRALPATLTAGQNALSVTPSAVAGSDWTSSSPATRQCHLNTLVATAAGAGTSDSTSISQRPVAAPTPCRDSDQHRRHQRDRNPGQISGTGFKVTGLICLLHFECRDRASPSARCCSTSGGSATGSSHVVSDVWSTLTISSGWNGNRCRPIGGAVHVKFRKRHRGTARACPRRLRPVAPTSR